MGLRVILHTPRLMLRLPQKSDYTLFEAFDDRNAKHLAPWRSVALGATKDRKDLMLQWMKEFDEGRSVRFLMFHRESADSDLIGVCNYSQIFRGPFQACYLGYYIDAACEGRGLMSEALEETIKYMFEKQNIHRIMANYMPSNLRSAKLLKKQGFAVEGLAKDYLFINGRWEDHVLTSLTNTKWRLKLECKDPLDRERKNCVKI